MAKTAGLVKTELDDLVVENEDVGARVACSFLACFWVLIWAGLNYDLDFRKTKTGVKF